MPAARLPGVRVSIPATSAYLGPGFDALGLAVDLRDELLVRVAGEGVRPGEWSIASYAGVSTGEDNLVLRAMRATFAELGWTPAELAARFVPRVPMSRGLGSSAAAICAGVTAALVLAGVESVQVGRDVAAEAWRAGGIPAFLSGSGPTVLALVRDPQERTRATGLAEDVVTRAHHDTQQGSGSSRLGATTVEGCAADGSAIGTPRRVFDGWAVGRDCQVRPGVAGDQVGRCATST